MPELVRTVVLIGTWSLVMMGGFAAVAAAQPANLDEVQVETTRLGDGLAMLVGGGGNVAVSFGADGVVLVDDQYAPMAPKIRDAVAKLSDRPVAFVVNTHWHQDHAGGNEALGAAGAVIVAHDAVFRRLTSDQFVPFFQRTLPAAPPAAHPAVTYETSVTLHRNGQSIELRHVPAAHTDGDSFVVFREGRVLHMGDTYFNGMYPYIDAFSGGTVAGMIAAVDRGLALTDEAWKIIPGHGPLAARTDLERFRAMLVGASDAVRAIKARGATVEEAVAAKPTAPWDAGWGGGFLDPDRFVQVLYGALP